MTNSELDERALLAALKAMGLDISPHHDYDGWGYTWLHRDWVGPFSTPLAALHAAFTAALLALSAAPVARSAAAEEEVRALSLFQQMHRAAETGKLQDGRIAHIELQRLLERWAQTLDGRKTSYEQR